MAGAGGGGGAVEAVSVFEAQAVNPIAAATANTIGMVALLTTTLSQLSAIVDDRIRPRHYAAFATEPGDFQQCLQSWRMTIAGE